MEKSTTIFRSLGAGPVLIASILIVAMFGGFAYGQTKAKKDCDKEKPIKESTKRKKNEIVLRPFVLARTTDPSPERAPRTPGRIASPGNSEKAISVKSNVYVSMCVKQGIVKINGWDRDEIRAFVKGGKELGFKVIERSGKEKLPVWVEVLGHDSSERRSGEGDKCLTGETIELDVPEGASVTIKGISSEAMIDSVKRASIEIIGGDILLSNISDKIEAKTQQGGVTVNNSQGKMEVSTTTGNIVAHNTKAVEIGDYFKAKTRSGAVTMQSIGQKEVSASSISGSINYLGEIQNYGQYAFNTTNGLINLIINEGSCFWITAAFGGRFVSDFPVTVITEDETESAVYLNGRVGECQASINLKSYSGSIRIRKKDVLDGDKPVEVKVP